jgi:TIR domain-containing protein
VPTIFISYRREDSAGYAGRLCESLERRLGRQQVFRDVDAIGPGQDFVDAIDARLRECRALLALIGREWLDAADVSGRRRLDQENDYLRLEIAAALARPDVLVVPVLVEGAAMPGPEDLPEPIRSLSRRQAVSLRDDAWDADVDRLVAALGGTSLSRLPKGSKWALLAVAALTVIFVARLFMSADHRVPTDPGQRARDEAPAAPGRSDGAGSTARTPASAIAIPRVAEVVGSKLMYALLSGSVARRGETTTLDLRLRFSNDESNPVNFWDDTFRLAVGEHVLSPTSGLNEIVAPHAQRQGVIRFEAPGGVTRAVLRVRFPYTTAEIPLDLSSTGGPAETDRPDAGDALAPAIVADLTRGPRTLLAGKEIDYTLIGARSRRFVNALRIVFNIRVANRGAYPFLFSSNAFRLVVDGQAAAPVDGPIELVGSLSTASADVVFDAPPTARAVILRVTEQGSVTDTPFDLLSSLR